MKTLTLNEARDALRIDPDQLDQCLIDHPELYYSVSLQMQLAVAKRDKLKADYEELCANIEDDVRKTAAAANVKMTDKAIAATLLTMPKVTKLQHEYLEAKAQAGLWEVAKEAFDKRGFMLTKLADMQIAQLHNLGLERGMTNSRASLAETSLRRDRERVRERYRP